MIPNPSENNVILELVISQNSAVCSKHQFGNSVGSNISTTLAIAASMGLNWGCYGGDKSGAVALKRLGTLVYTNYKITNHTAWEIIDT